MNKRGYTLSEAITYVGVGRRTFEALWRPHLNAFRCGTSVIVDRVELDALFERFKAGELGEGVETAPLSAVPSVPPSSAPVSPARRRSSGRGRSTPVPPIGDPRGFEAVAAEILKRRKSR